MSHEQYMQALGAKVLASIGLIGLVMFMGLFAVYTYLNQDKD